MPRNILTIAYTFGDGTSGEYTAEVDAWRDLENATRELQLHLIAQILDIQSWVVTRERAK